MRLLFLFMAALLAAPCLDSAETERCGRLMAEAERFRTFATAEKVAELRGSLPQLDSAQLHSLADKMDDGTELRMTERLLIVLLRLAELPRAGEGEEAYRQIVATMQEIEKDYLPESVAAEWRVQEGHEADREALVEQAYRAYDFANRSATYDESKHPTAFSKVLKPPALCYARNQFFDGIEIITQLNHITIINWQSGAIEIQRIDPALRSRLATDSDPLVVAMYNDDDYFRRLPTRTNLVIFRKPGASGTDVWH